MCTTVKLPFPAKLRNAASPLQHSLQDFELMFVFSRTVCSSLLRKPHTEVVGKAGEMYSVSGQHPWVGMYSEDFFRKKF